MSMIAVEATETKGEFAVRCNVTPGRVSQWIAAKKIKPTSLAGEGRAARIIIGRALADLNRTLDVSQRVGLNGLGTRLSVLADGAAIVPGQGDGAGDALPLAPAEASPSASAGAPLQLRDPADDIAERIAREKLRQAEIETRRREREEALQLGRYLLTEDAEAQMARTAGMVLTTVESGFNQIADALAAEFAIPRRDVLHTMTRAFRSVREAATRAFAEKAAAIAAAEAEAAAVDEAEGEVE